MPGELAAAFVDAEPPSLEIERTDDAVDVDDALVGEALGVGEDRQDARAQPVLGERRAVVRKPGPDHHAPATVLAESLRAGVSRHAVADDDDVVAADRHQLPLLAGGDHAVQRDDRDRTGRAAAADALGPITRKRLSGQDVRHAVVPEQERVRLGLDADADADADVVVDPHVHEVVALGWHGEPRHLRRRT